MSRQINKDGKLSEEKGIRGVKITPIGHTKETRHISKSKCGFSSIEDLLPIAYNPYGYRYFKTMRK